MAKSNLRAGTLVPILCVVVAAGLFLRTCNGPIKSGVFINWERSFTSNSYSASYDRMNGKITIPIILEGRQELTIDYELVSEKGTISIELRHPNGNTLEYITCENGNQSKAALARTENKGKYKLRIMGDDTKGSFSVSWKLTPAE